MPHSTLSTAEISGLQYH